MKKSIFLLILSYTLNVNAQDSCINGGINASIYDVTFESNWNEIDHSEIPTSAHWSNLLLVNHNTPNQFLEIGQLATTGIKDVAELGDNTAFSNEVQTAINNGDAQQLYTNAFSPNNATSTVTFEITVCNPYNYLTVVSMIAPSPDWFIAVNSFDITDIPLNSIDSPIVIDVFAYDAGTDDGINYDSSDSPNTPTDISMINGYPFNGIKIGTLTIEYKLTLLSLEDQKINKEVKLFPNPSDGNIFISGDTLSEIDTVTVYDILGSEVKSIKINTVENSITLNLSDLNKGIYLVQINTKDGHSKTQKLILQ